MSFHIKKRMCIFLLFFILFLIFLPWSIQQSRKPKGEELRKETMLQYHKLFSLLLEEESTLSEEKKQQIQAVKEAEKRVIAWGKNPVSYKDFQPWLFQMEATFQLLSLEEKEEWDKKYNKSDSVLKEDGTQYIKLLLEKLDQREEIEYQTLLFLGDHTGVRDLEGNPLTEGLIFTNNGSWKWEIEGEEVPWKRQNLCLTYRGSIWDVEETKEEAVLSNAWIVDRKGEEITFFYKNYYINCPYQGEEEEREQVADLVFQDGMLKNVVLKTDKITGKVMKLTAEEVELKEEGTFPLAKEIQYYKLHGPLKSIGRGEIPLGYGFTDFVVQDGQVVAALVAREEKMESIRVLLKTKGFQSYYHEEVEIFSQVDLEISSQDNVTLLPAGETLVITRNSELFQKNRIYIKPKALTGKSFFPGLERNNQGQGYYGSFEIEKREEGLLLLNEVLLEEYLYAVVPSEMPGYYPLEALKAQAISARTYAYERMITPALSAYGANLDDSSTYQVYNNISENANTTYAVKETKGKLLYTGEVPAATYYYSTSAGVGTDGSIWSSEGENPYSYLQAKEMAVKKSVDLKALQQEDSFREYITKSYSSHLEQEEGWYRWSYAHSNMETVKENLRIRLQQYPQYASVDPKEKLEQLLQEDFSIKNIEVEERSPGGSVNALLFHTDLGTIRIQNEYHIRAVLADGVSLVNLQNGNTYACNKLLPSAFLVLEAIREEEEITEIRILGGGFGHGVGMSQNGAKALANLGYRAEEILGFYYEDCEVRE